MGWGGWGRNFSLNVEELFRSSASESLYPKEANMGIGCRRECDQCPISSCSLNPGFHLFIQTFLREMSVEIGRRDR